MEMDFKLETESICALRNKYVENSQKLAEALYVYLKEINEIMGPGWHGKSSDKFTGVISEYTDAATEVINDTLMRGQILNEAAKTIVDVEEKCSELGSDVKSTFQSSEV